MGSAFDAFVVRSAGVAVYIRFHVLLFSSQSRNQLFAPAMFGGGTAWARTMGAAPPQVPIGTTLNAPGGTRLLSADIAACCWGLSGMVRSGTGESCHGGRMMPRPEFRPDSDLIICDNYRTDAR
jgi:hypothetical protein